MSTAIRHLLRLRLHYAMAALQAGAGRSRVCNSRNSALWPPQPHSAARPPSARAGRGCLSAQASGAVLLEIEGLEAKVAGTDKQILKGVNLIIREGEVHAIMGKNGSGKSTLSKVLVGHPAYEVTAGRVRFKGKDLLSLEAEQRSHEGLFLSFQAPVEIPGVRCAGRASLGRWLCERWQRVEKATTLGD